MNLHGLLRQLVMAAIGKPRTVAEAVRLWETMEIRPECRAEVEATARRHLEHRQRYEAVAAETGVPWFLIAALHDQECIQWERFDRYLGNGQMLNRRTTIVPAGRGPFSTWEAGAIDALTMKHRPERWDIGTILVWAEAFNGWGYYWRGIASPYVWAYTQHYTQGHFVADGKFRMWKDFRRRIPATRNKPGVATLIRAWIEQGVVRVEEGPHERA